jgi:hypothetical protein
MTMEELTKKQLYEIINKVQPEDGFEALIQMYWRDNNAKALFKLTGLDMSHLLTGPKKDFISLG